MPKYSVLISVYNGEKYLAECLDSVLVQSYTDFEIVAVDDGSTDSSGKILDSYAKKDSRIKVVHKKNQGVNLARRTAFENSVGEYILTVDCDDLIDSELIKSVDEKICKFGCDLVLFDVLSFYDDPSRNRVKTLMEEERVIEREDKKLLYKLLLGRKMNPLWMKCCRRESYGKGFEYESFTAMCHGEDWFQSAEIIHSMQRGYYIKKPLYHYRRLEGGLSRKYDVNSLRLNSDSLHEVMKMIKDDGCFDSEIEAKGRAYARMVVNTFLLALSESELTEKEKIGMVKKITDTDIYKIAVDRRSDVGSTKLTVLKFRLLKFGKYKLLFELIKSRNQ